MSDRALQTVFNDAEEPAGHGSDRRGRGEETKRREIFPRSVSVSLSMFYLYGLIPQAGAGVWISHLAPEDFRNAAY